MRLIDAEALEEEIVKTMRYVPKDAVLDIACMVNRAPTIEAKPVVHAHWEGDTCSHCKLPWNANMCDDADDWGYFDPMPDYCPNCGAQMDGTDTNVGSKDDNHIADTGKKGVKIPVISMEDVPKIMEEMEK